MPILKPNVFPNYFKPNILNYFKIFRYVNDDLAKTPIGVRN